MAVINNNEARKGRRIMYPGFLLPGLWLALAIWSSFTTPASYNWPNALDD